MPAIWMKRTSPATKSYKPEDMLGPKQEKFLKELINQKCKLSKREDYVIGVVLANQSYHENHQYHLNKLRKKYGHIMEMNSK